MILRLFPKRSFSSLVGAIDQSTTGVKFVVYDRMGNTVVQHMLAHEQISLNFGWLEHNPKQILSNLHKVIDLGTQELKQKVKPNKIRIKINFQKYDLSNLKAIGVTNQRETIVAWNKITGEPYHNAVVWSDTRTQGIVKKHLKRVNEDMNTYKHITGLPISTYFSGFKIQWLIENVPGIKQNLKNIYFGTMDSFIIWVFFIKLINIVLFKSI